LAAEGISRRGVADGRGVGASHRARGSHAFRCVSAYGVRRVARDGSLQQTCLAVQCRPEVVVVPTFRSAFACHVRTQQTWVTGSAGEANNRSRREGDSEQNAEPTTSARTRLGPSAMAVNNRCWRRVLPRRAPGPPTRQPRWGGYSLFAELALPVTHVRRAQLPRSCRPEGRHYDM